MPYGTNAELPDTVKKLPEEKQTLWREVFNSAVYDGGHSEEEAAKMAWAAVEKMASGMMGGDGRRETEDGPRSAVSGQSAQATFLAGIDLKDLVTRDLASETEVQIALPGHYIQQGKEFDITIKDFADAAKNFSAADNPLPVDYEHNTFVNGAEAPAAGWVKQVIDRGSQGLYAVIAWTKSAAERIRSGEYKFISPVFFFQARDTKTGAPIGTLLGPPALTNFPLIQGMQPVTARLAPAQATDDGGRKIEDGRRATEDRGSDLRSPVIGHRSSVPGQSPRIDTNQKEQTMFKKFLAALGISVAEEPSEEKAVEIVKAKMTTDDGRRTTVAAKGILAALDLSETASEDDVRGKILALKHPVNMIPAEQLVTLQEQGKKREIEDLVDKAISLEGKMYPHEKDWALHADREWNKENKPALLKAFLAGRPKVMPIGEKLAGKKEDTGAVVIDDIQAQINKQMGVSAELFAKYNSKN